MQDFSTELVRRSRARRDPRDRILDATAGLLDERGLFDFSFRDVAERAGVGLATVYRHFADQKALLGALTQRLRQERQADVAPLIDLIGEHPDWRFWLRKAFETEYRLRVSRPGSRIPRRVLGFVAELDPINEPFRYSVSERVGAAFRQRRPDLPHRMAHLLAATAVATAVSLMDMACAAGPDAPDIVEQAVQMLLRYLEPHLD